MKHFLFLIFFLLSANMIAQLNEQFSDGNITSDPTWLGNTENFIVNSDFRLQLDAPDAGASFLYTPVDFPSQDLHYRIDFAMDFSPSQSNNLVIYLALSDTDISNASGYYLKVGEDGSNDAIDFYQLTSGESDKIGSATMGAVSIGPINVALDINFIDNNWDIYASYDGSQFFGLEPEIIADNYPIIDGQFFGLECSYTSTRKDLFSFDNILIEPYQLDEIGPSLQDISVIDNNSIRLTFNEILDEESVNTNYTISPVENQVSAIDFDPSEPNIIEVSFVDSFNSTETNTITIQNVKDLAGNDSGEISEEFFFARKPVEGDLIINEVLTDPVGDGSDFFELYNLTNDFIDLSGCEIVNEESGNQETIDNYTISPNGYIAFTEKVDLTIEQYIPAADAIIVEQNLPAFNNATANFTFINDQGETIDFFDYDENFHLVNLNDTEGVSLEKIDPTGSNVGSENWTSAASSVNYGTPGYKNSSLIVSNSSANFSLVKKSFSPNMDGEDDLLGINYNLEKSGYISNIVIYDAEGNEIKKLQNNQSLSTSGIITWNGTDNDNIISDIGMYVVIGELFHADGSNQHFKLAFALLDFID